MRDGTIGRQLLNALSAMASELPKPNDSGETRRPPTGGVHIVCSMGIVAA